jgi:multidrug resistance protein, MATE family
MPEPSRRWSLALPSAPSWRPPPALLSGLGYEPGLVAEIGRFLWTISWGIPGFLGAAVLRFLLIAAFRTQIVMIVPLVAVPLNLVLNWVLIFGHWGMPALGSAGSGCATAIVQWLTLFSFALYMLIARARISVSMGRGAWRQIPGILRLGLPIAAMRGLEIGVFVMTGVMMGMIGADVLAAHQLVFNVAGVCSWCLSASPRG